MRKLSDNQVKIALNFAPKILSYEQLLELSNHPDYEIRQLARKRFAQYILINDVKDNEMAVHALELLPLLETSNFFSLDAEKVVKKVITYLNDKEIQLNHFVITANDLKTALYLMENLDYKLTKVEKMFQSFN